MKHQLFLICLLLPIITYQTQMKSITSQNICRSNETIHFFPTSVLIRHFCLLNEKIDLLAKNLSIMDQKINEIQLSNSIFAFSVFGLWFSPTLGVIVILVCLIFNIYLFISYPGFYEDLKHSLNVTKVFANFAFKQIFKKISKTKRKNQK